MTKLQKLLVAAAFALVAAVGIYQALQAMQLREQNRALQQQQAPLADQLQQLRRERDDATNRLAGLADELARAKKNPSEVLKLRGEVGALRQEKAVADRQSVLSKATANPETRKAMRQEQKRIMGDIYSSMAKRLKLSPEQTEQFNDLLADHTMDSMERISQVLHDGKSQAEVREIFSASDKAFQGKVQALLGDEALTQYQDYTKNLGNAIFVESLGNSMTGDAAAVADKKTRLMQAMQEATQSELAAAGLPPDYQTLTVLNFANFASEEEAAASLQLKDRIFGNAAARASTFLTADELNKFQEFRTTGIKNSQNIILMNRKLMSPVSQ